MLKAMAFTPRRGGRDYRKSPLPLPVSPEDEASHLPGIRQVVIKMPDPHGPGRIIPRGLGGPGLASSNPSPRTVPRTYMSASGLQSEISASTLANVARHQVAYLRQIDIFRQQLETSIRRIKKDEVALHKSIVQYANHKRQQQRPYKLVENCRLPGNRIQGVYREGGVIRPWKPDADTGNSVLSFSSRHRRREDVSSVSRASVGSMSQAGLDHVTASDSVEIEASLTATLPVPSEKTNCDKVPPRIKAKRQKASKKLKTGKTLRKNSKLTNKHNNDNDVTCSSPGSDVTSSSPGSDVTALHQGSHENMMKSRQHRASPMLPSLTRKDPLITPDDIHIEINKQSLPNNTRNSKRTSNEATFMKLVRLKHRDSLSKNLHVIDEILNSGRQKKYKTLPKVDEGEEVDEAEETRCIIPSDCGQIHPTLVGLNNAVSPNPESVSDTDTGTSHSDDAMVSRPGSTVLSDNAIILELTGPHKQDQASPDELGDETKLPGIDDVIVPLRNTLTTYGRPSNKATLTETNQDRRLTTVPTPSMRRGTQSRRRQKTTPIGAPLSPGKRVLEDAAGTLPAIRLGASSSPSILDGQNDNLHQLIIGKNDDVHQSQTLTRVMMEREQTSSFLPPIDQNDYVVKSGAKQRLLPLDQQNTSPVQVSPVLIPVNVVNKDYKSDHLSQESRNRDLHSVTSSANGGVMTGADVDKIMAKAKKERRKGTKRNMTWRLALAKVRECHSLTPRT